MNRKATYLILCVLGTVLPHWQFVPSTSANASSANFNRPS